jgi:hypothetical protein
MNKRLMQKIITIYYFRVNLRVELFSREGIRLISERIFNDKFSIEEIINMILEQQIDFLLQQLYSEIKVNTATPSKQEKEDVA